MQLQLSPLHDEEETYSVFPFAHQVSPEEISWRVPDQSISLL
jgi:hypothetical protein